MVHSACLLFCSPCISFHLTTQCRTVFCANPPSTTSFLITCRLLVAKFCAPPPISPSASRLPSLLGQGTSFHLSTAHQRFHCCPHDRLSIQGNTRNLSTQPLAGALDLKFSIQGTVHPMRWFRLVMNQLHKMAAHMHATCLRPPTKGHLWQLCFGSPRPACPNFCVFQTSTFALTSCLFIQLLPRGGCDVIPLRHYQSSFGFRTSVPMSPVPLGCGFRLPSVTDHGTACASPCLLLSYSLGHFFF